MKKSDIIESIITVNPRFDPKIVHDAANYIVASMREAIAKNKRIEVRGFGSMQLSPHISTSTYIHPVYKTYKKDNIRIKYKCSKQILSKINDWPS